MNKTKTFEQNIGLAYTLAGKYQGSGRSRGIHFDDITQQAKVLLWEAVSKWEPSKATLTTFYFRHGHKGMQRYINSPEHYDAHTLERKPSGNSYHYIRRPATISFGASPNDPPSMDSSGGGCAKRGLDATVLNSNIEVLEKYGWYAPPDAPERSVLADQVLDTLLSTEWPDRSVAALLGHLEGYSQPELAKELGTSRQTIFEDIHKTLDMLRMKLVV